MKEIINKATKPNDVSKQVLEIMDESIKNFKEKKVTKPIDLKKFKGKEI